MNVVVTFKFCQTVFPAVIMRKIEKFNDSQTNSHRVVTLLSQVFVLYFIFVHISSILFSSLLQLHYFSLTEFPKRPLSVIFLIPDADQLFHNLGDILFRCFVSSTPAALKSLPMHADDNM